jgi:hypothetical protein
MAHCPFEFPITKLLNCQITQLHSAMIRLTHSKMSVSAKWLRRWSLRFSVFVAVLALPQALRSQAAKSTWTDAAADLVAKTLARAGQASAVSMDLSNASSLSSDDAGTVRRLLEAQLAARGARIVKPEQAAADLRFTLSENAGGLLWIAEIISGSKRDLVMTQVARSEAQSAIELAPAITLHKELIWSQYEPILDFAIWENRSRLLVLDPWTVSLYRLSNSRWSLERSLPIPHSRPSPMDTRGRLLMLRDHKFEAFVPGQHCTGTSEGGLRLECRQADDPWPLAGENSPRAFFSATRNFFTGVLTGAPSVAPFFSAAFVQNGNRDIWTFAGTDGRVRQLANGENELRVPWGSTLAGVKSGCGSGWQVLAAGTGDFAQRDLVQAFELSQGVAAVTSAVEVPGPVTAIWPTAEANAVAVVARNLTNGKYEGYGVSINCR